MEPDHPNLCFRPKRNPNLKRPTREHPVLGRIEYTNGSGWQSLVDINGHPVHVELQNSARITEDEIDVGASFLDDVREHEAGVREATWKALRAESFFPALVGSDAEWLSRTADSNAINPCGLNVWPNNADIFYEFVFTEDFGVCTAFEIMANVDQNTNLVSVSANQLDLSVRAKRILKRPVPRSLAGFENSLPDQFVARAAVWGWFRYDVALRGLLGQSTTSIRTSLDSASNDAKPYLLEVESLLRLITHQAAQEDA